MATTKPSSTATTDPGVTTEQATAAQQQVQPVDFAASPTWGQGGCFVIDEQGQRVPAPAN